MNKKLLNKIVVSLFTAVSIAFVHTNSVEAKTNKARIYGKSRIETSVEISKEGWKDGSNVAVIAQGYSYADALSSAPLAKKYNAPILLTETSKLSDCTVNELKRLKVKDVYLIGGPKVVSENVAKQLKNANINNIKRLYGATRYETSLEVAKEIGKTNEVFITSGKGYADSLSIASIAAQKGVPILFSEKDYLKDCVKQYIKNNGINKIYVVGGKKVISDKAISGLNNTERLAGNDRFDTNKKVLERFKPDINFENVYVVQGAGPRENEFADALSCSALAARKAAPIVLTYKDITPGLGDFIKENLTSLSTVTAIGGETVVPSKILDKLEASDAKTIEISKNNTVFGDKEKSKIINGDVVINADNVTVQNLDIKGILTINPGRSGSTNVKNITANTIVVKSGAQNSIHFSKVKAENLILDSKSNVRVELNNDSKIATTRVKTSSILDEVKGTFGNVIIEYSTDVITENKEVELRGNFHKPVIINDKVSINCKGSVDKLLIKPEVKSEINVKGTVKSVEIAKESEVNLLGNISEVKVFKESKIHIGKASKVDKISAVVKAEINVEKGAVVNKVEKATDNVKINGEVKEVVSIKADEIKPEVNPEIKPEVKPEDKDSFTLIVSKDNGNSILINKTLKVENDKNAMDYLKSVASVKVNNGFINGIQEVVRKTSNQLTEEQKKRGVLGVDWYIYLNGSLTSTGVMDVYPKSGDTLKFDYHEWDWKSLVNPGEVKVMPIKLLDVPSSIESGRPITIKATCVYQPVYYAVVKVDGKEVAKTDVNGEATIKIDSAGKHTISVEKEGGKDEKIITVNGTSGSGTTTGGISGGTTGGTGSQVDPEKPSNNSFKVEVNGNKVCMKITNTEDVEVAITVFDSNESLAYIGQAVLKDGEINFNTVLDNGKYHAFYRFKNGEKIEKVEFEVK